MPLPRIQLCDVDLHYLSPQGEIPALHGVSLAAAPGEFLAIVGPSGCGKSTILSLIAGILQPTAGQILIEGQPVKGPSRRIGYMLQRDCLLPWRTVVDNCLIGAEVRGLDLTQARAKVLRLLARCGLQGFCNAYPDQLSGGMRQRVALVRTLALDPDILLLDEPFSALDFQTRLTLTDEVFSLLRDGQKTIILVTHDISEAIAMSDRVIVLTPRPAQVKSEHVIRFSGAARPTPFSVREAPEYTRYFHRIWEELGLHAGA